MRGKDPRGVRGLWQEMNDYAFKVGTVGIMGLAISVLDTALWDLKAKIAGEPLWRMLGSDSPRVRAYASGIDICLSDEELHNYYRQMASKGINVGKLKGGISQEDDLRRLGIMQDALSSSGARPDLPSMSTNTGIRNKPYAEPGRSRNGLICYGSKSPFGDGTTAACTQFPGQ